MSNCVPEHEHYCHQISGISASLDHSTKDRNDNSKKRNDTGYSDVALFNVSGFYTFYTRNNYFIFLHKYLNSDFLSQVVGCIKLIKRIKKMRDQNKCYKI